MLGRVTNNADPEQNRQYDRYDNNTNSLPEEHQPPVRPRLRFGRFGAGTSGVELTEVLPSPCALRFNVECAMEGVVVAAVGVGAEAGVEGAPGPEFGVADGCDCCPEGLFCFEAPSWGPEALDVDMEEPGGT